MNIITEKDIIKIIKRILKNSYEIPVTVSIRNGNILNQENYEKLICQLEREFDISVNREEHLQMLDTVIDIVSFVNKKKGFDKITLRYMIDDICYRNLQNTALEVDEKSLTYEQLIGRIKKMAVGLNRYGIKKGTHVSIILDNCMEYIIVYFALFYIGAIPIPFNTRWLQNEIENVLKDSQSDYIIVQDRGGKTKFADVILPMISKGYQINTVFYKGENYYGEKGCSLESLGECNGQINLEEIQGEDEAMISYTSGTTGTPKGVVLKQNDVVSISLYASKIIVEDEISLSVAPLYSAQGFLSLLINLFSESKFKMLSSFNPNDILKEITKGEISFIHTQPTMWNMILNSKNINFAKFERLNRLVVSGSFCAPELAKRIEKRLGCTLLNVYGLIEGTSVVTTTRKEDSDEIRYNTVGRPIPGVRIKIVDKDRNLVPKGDIGELAVKGYIMQGYYRNSEMTNKIVDEDGWLFTGDLARYYDEENIAIVGRCKEMVIRGGFNVYPSDIEEILLQNQDIQMAAVVGRPNEILGEELIAFVVPKAGVKIDKYVISRYLFENISNYKQPDYIYLINDMPILLAGKIDKKQLGIWAAEGIPDDKKILFD